MKKNGVEVTEAAFDAISEQARYIAVDQQQPMNAEEWLQSAWEVIDSLETLPHCCAIAEENEDVDYEVRFILAGRTSLLFTVDEDRETVWIIALRGEGQLPQSDVSSQFR